MPNQKFKGKGYYHCIKQSFINKCLQRNVKTAFKSTAEKIPAERHAAYGYVWRYKDEPFDKYRVVSKYQPVNQYSKDDVFIETHNTANQASKKVGLKYSGDISKCCKGKQKTCGGFKWFYADDPNQPDKSKIITNNVA